MSCPDWKTCFHEECFGCGRCEVIRADINGPCPYVHLCKESSCRKEGVCLNSGYWSAYWKIKTVAENEALGGTKKERRKARKIQKKEKGIKKYWRERKEAAIKEVFASIPHCVKDGDWCDKKQACDVLGQCVITLSRIQANPAILEELRGPRSCKQIINVLAKHDPEPMKSYYSHLMKK